MEKLLEGTVIGILHAGFWIVFKSGAMYAFIRDYPYDFQIMKEVRSC